MSIFSRRKGQPAPSTEEPTTVDTSTDPTVAADPPVDADDGAAAADPGVAHGPHGDGDAGRSIPGDTWLAGPRDVEEVDGLGGRVDLGSLWVSGAEGMQLRLEIEQASGQVIAATVVLGESAAQLQAFAAPKSSGLWREIRGEIAASIVEQGGTADDVDGPFGPELRTRMPSAGPDGRTVFAPARFLGFDGPRWFLRAVLSGRAAIDEGAAAPLLDVIRQVVVVRGQSPMAPRELLPLALPAEAGASGEAGAEESRPDGTLDPFERGPEITEVR